MDVTAISWGFWTNVAWPLILSLLVLKYGQPALDYLSHFNAAFRRRRAAAIIAADKFLIERRQNGTLQFDILQQQTRLIFKMFMYTVALICFVPAYVASPGFFVKDLSDALMFNVLAGYLLSFGFVLYIFPAYNRLRTSLRFALDPEEFLKSETARALELDADAAVGVLRAPVGVGGAQRTGPAMNVFD